MQRFLHPQFRRILLRLCLAILPNTISIRFRGHKQQRQIIQMVLVLFPQIHNVREAVRVAGIVGVEQNVALGYFGGVVEDGGLVVAKFGEDERYLFAAGEFDRVDGVARLKAG
ncbi:MAG: hypothetical protein LQ337_003805, partial [Flavoplaca oasis]